MRPSQPFRRLWRAAVSGARRAARRMGDGLRSFAGEAEELREGEEQLRIALEAASLGLWYADLETGEFVASPGANAMHGLPPDTPLDIQKALEVVHPDDRDLVRERVEQAIARRRAYEAEFRVVRPDGSVRWMLSRGRSYEKGAEMGGGRLIGVVQDITARKLAEEENVRLLGRERAAHVEAREAEEALEESEERFRAAFGSAAVGVALISIDGRYLQVNPKMCEITGYSEEELVGESFENITHPDDLRRDHEGVRRLLSGETRYFYSEKRYLHKSGRAVWVQLSSSVVRDVRGEPLYFVTQAQDITRMRADREKLERLSHQNELILASAAEGIYGLNLAERTTFVNPAAEHLLGYDPGELTGRHQHDIIRHLRSDGVPYPEDDCPVHAALRDGKVHASSDDVFWRKDGTSFPVEYVSTPIRQHGEVVGAVVTFRDITERRRSEEALKESEERFRLLAEKTSDLICLHEPDGRYVYVSPSCRRLLGYEPDELLGVDPYDLFHPDDARRIRSEAHADVLEGQSAVSITYRIRKKTGEYTWFETLTEPILDENGSVVRLQTSSRDVSDRKHAEEALAEAARARTEFLAEVSHELRTPLTVIRGNAEVGLELGRGCPHEEVLEEIVKEAATMSRMVEDLLFLARSDSLSPPFELQPVAVKPFLAGLEKGAEALAQEHGAPLVADLAGSGWVEMDPSRVKQAVLALVHNAAKFGRKGGVVSLSSATPDGELRIEVEDGGPGIPEKHLPHIFERFYRVDVPGEPGSGLGLSVAKSIVEAHGGRIEAESRPGEGTKMSLCLPLLAPPEKVDPARS